MSAFHLFETSANPFDRADLCLRIQKMFDADLIGCLPFPVGGPSDKRRVSFRQCLLCFAGGVTLVAVLYGTFLLLGFK
jgi:hypothetical protein